MAGTPVQPAPRALQRDVPPETPLLLGIDLGAGSGAKMGVFTPCLALCGEWLLPSSAYGTSADALADALCASVRETLSAWGVRASQVSAAGIASPGLLCSNGSYRLAANIPFLVRENLPALLRRRLGVPVGIENDANAGGLAEWSALRTELVYWVLGGGWGGAWVSSAGEVRFPALDWDGQDASLHYSNEPGYAIPLAKERLRGLFREDGVGFAAFEAILVADLKPPGGILRGPSGSADHLRAAAILSGPGRWRLFRAVAGEDRSHEERLDAEGRQALADPASAGRPLDALSRLGVEAALRTDRLFGRVLAEAGGILLEQAERDGCPAGVPVCLGGRPSRAMPFFGPAAQDALVRKGFTNYLRPAVLDSRGLNANLVGAAVVAEQARDRA